MGAEIGGVAGVGAAAYGNATAGDPRAQARLLQKEFDTLLQPTQLRMQVDVDAGRVVVQVISASSGEVLRQVPSDEALQIAREIARRHAAGIRA